MEEKTHQVILALFEHVDDAVREGIAILLEKAHRAVGHFAGIVMNGERELVVSIDGVAIVLVQTEVIVQFLHERLIVGLENDIDHLHRSSPFSYLR